MTELDRNARAALIRARALVVKFRQKWFDEISTCPRIQRREIIIDGHIPWTVFIAQLDEPLLKKFSAELDRATNRVKEMLRASGLNWRAELWLPTHFNECVELKILRSRATSQRKLKGAVAQDVANSIGVVDPVLVEAIEYGSTRNIITERRDSGHRYAVSGLCLNFNGDALVHVTTPLTEWTVVQTWDRPMKIQTRSVRRKQRSADVDKAWAKEKNAKFLGNSGFSKYYWVRIRRLP